MKQISTNLKTHTIGLDVGDKHSVAIILDENAAIIEELKIPSTRAGITSAFASRSSCRVALEVGTHSPWMSEQIKSYGHKECEWKPGGGSGCRSPADAKRRSVCNGWLC